MYCSKPPGRDLPARSAPARKTRNMACNEPILAHLRKFREINQKDEIVSRNGLTDGFFEARPELMGVYTRKQINRQITDILADAGVDRIKKVHTTRPRYFWPLDLVI